MYKTIFFVHKSDDESIKTAVIERVIPALKEIFNTEIKTGKVESNLLNPVKYDLYFEVTCKDKSEFDKQMNSPNGRNVNKELAGILNDVTIYSIDIQDSK